MAAEFGIDDWREIRRQARDMQKSLLWQYMLDTFTARANAALTDIENEKSPVDVIRYNQGVRKSNIRATMILRDAVRTADRNIPRRTEDD